MSVKDKKEIKSEKEEKIVESRRRALKKIVLGSGVATLSTILPNEWVKPIVRKIGPTLAYASSSTTSAPTTTWSPTTTQAPVKQPKQPNVINKIGVQDARIVKSKVSLRGDKFKNKVFSSQRTNNTSEDKD